MVKKLKAKFENRDEEEDDEEEEVEGEGPLAITQGLVEDKEEEGVEEEEVKQAPKVDKKRKAKA